MTKQERITARRAAVAQRTVVDKEGAEERADARRHKEDVERTTKRERSRLLRWLADEGVDLELAVEIDQRSLDWWRRYFFEGASEEALAWSVEYASLQKHGAAAYPPLPEDVAAALKSPDDWIAYLVRRGIARLRKNPLEGGEFYPSSIVDAETVAVLERDE